jgi:tetratricopeptide (TPR) repeat protein
MFSLRGRSQFSELGYAASYVLTSTLLLALSTGMLWAEDLSKAVSLYHHTDFEGSLALLDKNSSNPETLFLLGRNYFMLGDFKKSTEFLAKAVDARPTSSEYRDWLGRSYGKRAETSNYLTAPGYASKARQSFEKAIELDPNNKDALADVFDYYLEAPGFLGGGYDKAMAIAERTTIVDPAEAYFEKAKLAQKRKEFQTAEQSLRHAVALAPHEVGHLVTLARFLANQGRNRESDAVFQEAAVVNPNAPEVWFARADVLIKQKRNPEEAKSLLEKYMHASLTVDDPPKQEARRLLKQVGGA